MELRHSHLGWRHVLAGDELCYDRRTRNVAVEGLGRFVPDGISLRTHLPPAEHGFADGNAELGVIDRIDDPAELVVRFDGINDPLHCGGALRVALFLDALPNEVGGVVGSTRFQERTRDLSPLPGFCRLDR